MQSGRRVLVAEDNDLVRSLLFDTLEDAGCTVLAAAHGAEAVHLLQDPLAVDLLITDVDMPHLSGLDVARHLWELNPAVPVLFVTALPDVVVGANFNTHHELLPKPFGLDNLLGAVDRLLAFSDDTRLPS